ncbi:MAG: hypothetical protein FJ388_15860 [Verrucomicrobia bacterium]|nr:hypothetical protein [Verrucomicrobiota bacterium]
MNKLKLGAAMAACLVLAGCTATEQGAGYGTLGGAAIGGALGGWQGAAIGAGAGALTGALAGSAVDAQEERRARYYAASAPPPAASYPTGILTDRPGYVRSPWNPNGPLVDVTGFPRGSLVRDPITQKVFIVP